jgi:hypothetical protein
VGGTGTLTAPDIVLTLLPPGSLSGLVTIATGSNAQPAAGATVRLFQADNLALVRETVTFAPATVEANTSYTFNYRIDNVPAGNYVVQVASEGLTSDPVQIAITVSPSVETRNVNFRLLPLKVYGPGLQLISTPYDYSDRPTRSVFGLTPEQPAYALFNVADWVPQQNDYVIGPDIRLVLGKGYFVRLGDVAPIQVRGRSHPAGAPFDLALPASNASTGISHAPANVSHVVANRPMSSPQSAAAASGRMRIGHVPSV